MRNGKRGSGGPAASASDGVAGAVNRDVGAGKSNKIFIIVNYNCIFV